MKSATTKSILLAATALSVALTATPAMAADDDIIIVTAQRMDEDIQDVPIAITYFSPEKIANNNILSARDIATYTPGVVAQTRFGNDVTVYTIRGFAQEMRTTATVGTYFAEVVAPRGNGVSQGGDGASPGALFDLENVQVLKGPQGTLFGRNTTGGSVLLVPVKPRDELEGYIEGTAGNLNRWRVQAVLNLPISDTFRIRLGVDRHMRDGYIKNLGFAAKHDDDMGSIDITAFRASAVWDITPDLENYTIFTHSESKGSGALHLLKDCFTDTPTRAYTLGNRCVAQRAIESATGDWWTGSNANPQGESYNKEMRIINRTTFDISDNVTLTNIFGYSKYEANQAIMAFGVFSSLLPEGTPITGPGDVLSFVPINANPDLGRTANQQAIVEELRLNGTHGALTWQTGVYYEKNSPNDWTGTFAPAFTSCVDIERFMCGANRSGTIQRVKFWTQSTAAYAQATYDISEQLSVTGGIRYTQDKTRSDFSVGRIIFGTDPSLNTYRCTFAGMPDSGQTFNAAERATRCMDHEETKTSAPTWMFNVQYKPTNDILAYAKWSRGYRQGSLSPASPRGLVKFGEETIDTYEIGAKTSWYGAVRGTFNVAAYYNDFRNQQVQAGVTCIDGTCLTTAVINAGASTLYGLEADLMIEPTEWFRLDAAYSYNNTKLKEAIFPDLTSQGFLVRELEVGGPLPLAVPHSFNATATIFAPIDESLGRLSISGTVIHYSSYRAVADATKFSGLGILPKRTFGNVNLNWYEVAGGPIDAAIYVTNVTNEKMITHINDQSNRGLISYAVDEQRQFGIRIKYRFGSLAN